MANYSPADPNDDGRRKPSSIRSTPTSDDLTGDVIGQTEACRLLRAAFLRHLCAGGQTEPIVLVGTAGCGKRTAVLELSAKFDVPIADIELLHLADGDRVIQRVALKSLRKRVEEVSLLERSAILVRGIDVGSASQMSDLKAVIAKLKDQTPLWFAEHGNKMSADLSRCLKCLSVRVPHEEDVETISKEILSTPSFDVSTVIPFQALPRQALYAVLTASSHSPLHRVRENLMRAGFELDLTEQKAWQLVDEAIKDFPTQGGHALRRVLGRLELELWSEISVEREGKACGRFM